MSTFVTLIILYSIITTLIIVYGYFEPHFDLVVEDKFYTLYVEFNKRYKDSLEHEDIVRIRKKLLTFKRSDKRRT